MQMLSPMAISNLQPSQLGFSLAAVYRNAQLHLPSGDAAFPHTGEAASPAAAAAAVAVACRPRVQDLTRRVQDMGLRLAGEVWGLRLALGEGSSEGSVFLYRPSLVALSAPEVRFARLCQCSCMITATCR